MEAHSRNRSNLASRAMATLSNEEQELIARDREQNPSEYAPAGAAAAAAAVVRRCSDVVVVPIAGCFYSTALSQSCRSINGDSKCELVKKIFRQCPGRSKVRALYSLLLSHTFRAAADEITGVGAHFKPHRGDGGRAQRRW